MKANEEQEAGGNNRELLTFTLGREAYGIDLLKVQEIRGYDSVTTIANRVVGMVVDGVSDVIALTSDQVKAAPEFGGTMDARYITGLGTVDERMIIVVDIEKLMTSRDMDLVEMAAA